MIGASVRGPRHALSGEPNQDSWGSHRVRAGHVLVVCDGLGSCQQSHVGSKAACDAVRVVMKSLEDDITGVEFGQQVAAMWLQRVGSGDPARYATTCLVSARLRSGRLLVGGIGDGLAAVVRAQGHDGYRVVTTNTSEFGETAALGDGREAAGWKLEEFDDSDGSHRVLLATDGVSNDLIDDRVPNLIAWLVDECGSRSRRGWRTRLRRMLTDWPTPGSTDDRTLAVMWTEAEAAHE